MFISLYFCADGILRAKHNDEPLIPMSFIQKNLDNNDDFSFWAQWWQHNVYFEDGLTLVNFFCCLEPWSKFFSTLTGVDIDVYLEEMRKPCAIEKQSRMKYIEICKEILFEPQMKFLDNMAIEEMFALLEQGVEDKKKRLAQLTGMWQINNRNSISCFAEGDTRYAFMLSHPETMANVPLVLNNKQAVYFSNHIVKRFIDKETPVFHEKLPCVLNSKGGGEILLTEIHYSFRQVVEMFFSSFDKTPDITREFIAQLYAKSQAHSDYLKEQEKKKNAEKMEEHKVISIKTGKEITSDNVDSTAEKKENTVSFGMSPAFSSNIEKWISPEEQLWNKLLDQAHEDNVVLRIGTIEKQAIPEIRLMGRLVSSEDYVQPGNPKYI